MGSLIRNVFRFLFAWIDSIVIRLITMIYKLFTNMSDLVIYSDNIIKTLGRRIGLILGIFMLFKLAINLINYMISPDKINDKSQGGGKLIINVIISLSLLMSINFIFKEVYFIQGKVVESRIIEKVFFGSNSRVTSNNQNIAGDYKFDIGYYLYSGFFLPNDDIFNNTCDDLWDVSADITVSKTANTRSCNELLKSKTSDDIASNIYKTRNTLDMSYVFSDWDTVTAKSSGKYVFDYIPIISTAAGIICLLILISFSMDLATRAIKLFFLQVIAPIPILSNIDLGKGQDIFKKWVKQCVNTYLTVFLRIIALDFAVFMMVLLRGNYKSVFTNNVWLNIFLIIGCLMFAKQVPKLLEDVFGIKMDGMTLHPLKNFQENALFGKQITGAAAGLTAAGLAGAAAFGANAIATEGNIFKRLGSGIGGATSASFRGLGSTLKGKKFGEVYKGAYSGVITARNNRDIRDNLDISSRDIRLNNMRRSLGMDTVAEVQDAEIKVASDFSKSSETNVSISEAEVDKNAQKIQLSNFNGGNAIQVGGSTYTTLAELREGATDQSKTAEQRAEINDKYQKVRGDIAQILRERSAQGTVAAAGSQFANITTFDKSALETIKVNTLNMIDIYRKNKDKDVFKQTTYKKIIEGEKVHKSVNEISNSIQNSEAFRKAHKVQEQTNREKK